MPLSQRKDSISLTYAVGIVAGGIIGSGIFMTPGGILSSTGSFGMSMVVWIVASVNSFLSALCYAELALLLKESGAEYIFARHAYGEMVAYLVIMSEALVTQPGSLVLMTYAFSGYFVELLQPGCQSPDFLTKTIAAIAVLILMVVHVFSIKLSLVIQQTTFYIKIGTLAIISIVGILQLIDGQTDNFIKPFAGSTSNFLDYGTALVGGLYSYNGWYLITSVTEEVKNPKKNIPLCMLISLGLVTIVYLFVNIAYATVLTIPEIKNSDSVASDFAYQTLGSYGWLITLGVVFSTFGAANSILISISRSINVAGRYGHFPRIASYTGISSRTPVLAVIVTAMITLLYFTIPGSSFSDILNYFSVVKWTVKTVGVFAVVMLRFIEPYSKQKRTFQVPLFVPIIAGCVNMFTVICPIISDPDWLYILMYGIIFATMIIYFAPKTLLKRTSKTLTVKLQLVFKLTQNKLD